jgi:hypothetical protein
LAWNYIEAAKGGEESETVINAFESDEEYLPVIYPTDDVIQLQIDKLKKLQKHLRVEDEVRSEWLFWNDQFEPDRAARDTRQ